MLRRCLKDNCVARPTLVCLCTPNRYFMCNKHLSDHLDNDIGEHKLEDLYIPPNPEIKRSMIERLNLIRSEIARFMSNLIHESSKLIKEIEKQVIISSQNLLECDNRCKKLMFEVSQIVEIEKFGN